MKKCSPSGIRVGILLAVIIAATSPLFAQMEIGVHSGIEVPVTRGTYPMESGMTATGELSIGLPFLPRMSALGEFSYTRHRFTDVADVQFLSGQLGALYRIPLSGNFSISPFLAGGYFYNWSNDLAESGGNPLLSAGIRGDYRITGALHARLQGSYRVYTGAPEPLFTAAVLTLGLQYRPGEAGRPANLEIAPPDNSYLFPIYRYRYDSHPFSPVSLTNREKEPLTDITIRFFVPEYMREPKLCGSLERLEPGSTAEVGLLALFTDEILEITEGKKTEGTVSVEYRFRDKTFTETRTDTMDIIFRNGMTWEDDRSAACFITARDPRILAIGKRLAGYASKVPAGEVPSSLIEAAGVYAFVSKAGLRYSVDPSSPYASLSENAGSIDYLQFPIQTLNYYGGDCDDLSILYSALLESMGIPTAFITVPGHIYIALDSGLTPAGFSALFADSRNSIDYKGRAWVPLEVTSIGDSFQKAWDLGWEQWVSNPGERKLLPVQEAWEHYPPVQPVFREEEIFTYDPAAAEEGLRMEAARFTGSTLARLSRPLQEALAKNSRDYRTRTRLGILYARFGDYSSAEPLFREVLRQRQSPGMHVNLGNIAFIRGDYSGAAAEYGSALAAGINDPFILGQLAESHQQIGNYEKAEMYAAMITDEETAEDSRTSARAANLSAQEAILSWIEE